jgi:fatty acid desaturase
MIINGKKIDTKEWRKWHPGGIMIQVPDEDMDATILYNSYHKNHHSDENFYVELKEAVHGLGINLRESVLMYFKAAFILIMSALSWYACFVFGDPRYSPMMGFFKAMVGVNIQHDANHGAFSSNPLTNEIMGYTLDAYGASSYVWKQTHVKGHHVNTNHREDPDIRTNDPDVRTIGPWDATRWYHAYQWLYLPVLYGLLSLKSCTIDDFDALVSGRVGDVKIKPMSGHDAHMFWMFKIFSFVVHVAVPVALVGLRRYALTMGMSELCTGIVLANLFQVAHVSKDATFHDGRATSKNWARRQVESSCDFAPGSLFWTHVSGGLNHQVVHHLFPGVNHCHYPRLWKIVRDVCKKHDIKYVRYDSFREAIAAHYTHNYLSAR